MNERPGRHRAQPYHVPRRRVSWRALVAWFVCALGIGLFIASRTASAAGVVILPFDHHHIFGQAGGLVVALWGVRAATRPRP